MRIKRLLLYTRSIKSWNGLREMQERNVTYTQAGEFR